MREYVHVHACGVCAGVRLEKVLLWCMWRATPQQETNISNSSLLECADLHTAHEHQQPIIALMCWPSHSLHLTAPVQEYTIKGRQCR